MSAEIASLSSRIPYLELNNESMLERGVPGSGDVEVGEELFDGRHPEVRVGFCERLVAGIGKDDEPFGVGGGVEDALSLGECGADIGFAVQE